MKNTPAPPSTPVVTAEPAIVAAPGTSAQPRVTIQLPRRYMDRPATQRASPLNETGNVDSSHIDESNDESEDDDQSQQRPRYDVSFVPDYPMWTTHSGLDRDGGGGGSALLIVDSAVYLHIAFPAGLPGGIQLSELPGPRNVREAMAAHDADGWKEAMMANLKSHDVYKLVPRVGGLCTLKLSRVLHRNFKEFSTRTRPGLLPTATNHAPVSITMSPFRLWCTSCRFALYLPWYHSVQHYLSLPP
jgi:hypothetical protein